MVSVDARASIREAASAMKASEISALAVMDDDGVAGLVSERDIAWALADGADPDTEQVGEVMSRDPRYLTLADSVATAVEIMLSAGVRHLPVLDEGVPVGMVSIRDLARAVGA